MKTVFETNNFKVVEHGNAYRVLDKHVGGVFCHMTDINTAVEICKEREQSEALVESLKRAAEELKNNPVRYEVSDD